jgi:hypothetical protein
MTKRRLGEVLCERGHIGAADLKRFLQEQQGKAIRLGELLLQRKLVSKKDLAAAEIVIKAAQTCHFVISTLHTNDSISALTRLLDLGVPGYQIGGALSAIIAHRLIRRLCSCHCSSAPTEEYKRSIMAAGLMEPPGIRNVANGCEACDFTGYRGRIGIYEMLRFNDALRQSARSGNHNDEMRILARHNGIKFMQECALDLVRDGLTTFEEVQRVVALSQITSETCGSCARELSPNFAFCPFRGGQTAQLASVDACAERPGQTRGGQRMTATARNRKSSRAEPAQRQKI